MFASKYFLWLRYAKKKKTHSRILDWIIDRVSLWFLISHEPTKNKNKNEIKSPSSV